MDLLIVESPAKVKTIKKFLGKGYAVEASMGHVRDLPKSKLGVDIENDFTPKYVNIRGKNDVLKTLRSAAKEAKNIYLATDPDREGEAISWHLAQMLGVDTSAKCRVVFNEITESAVKQALKKPRPIDMDLVDAQQARRVLDRVVGYQISPLLWRKVRKGLSAGRVQSVAARLVCEREKEIERFVPEEYWKIIARFEKDGKEFDAQYYGRNGKQVKLTNQAEADKVFAEAKPGPFIVEAVKEGRKTRRAAAPFTTSTLQQEASRRYGFSTKRTMMLAQQLYEGIEIAGEGTVGLVTYIRTDSTRIADEAMTAVRQLIEETYGSEYLPAKPNIYKTKDSAQDAHEAIRPTSLARTPASVKDSLGRDQYRLYKLIYERFLASQMTPAVYATLTVDIDANGHTFRATGSKKIFPGFTVIYMEQSDNEEESDEQEDIPALKEKDTVALKELTPQQNFTQPPPRYTEATLVRTLEEMGIGRPSTYAPTISTIIARGYVERDKRVLKPTDLGMLVNDLMTGYFMEIVDYDFTADMEEKLDMVEEGKIRWQDILKGFYPSLQRLIENADKSLERVKIPDEETDEVCEKCGARMVIRHGRYGKFLACPNFPECRNTKPINEKVDAKCPKCGGHVVVKRSKKGKMFYGCDRYPACDFISWDLPHDKPCEKCGAFMVVKERKSGEKFIQCSNRECGHRIPLEPSE
jgi:DNA topoisomerase-1